MGAFLDKPKTEKTLTAGAANGLRYSLCSMQGWRIDMEDAHAISMSLPLPHLSSWSFFAVFDGHAGNRVANLSSEMLLNSILSEEIFKDKNLNNNITSHLTKIEESLRNSFLSLDNQLRSEVKRLQRKSSENSPPNSSKDSVDHSGSTVICALVSPEYIFICNCGDSRAIIVRSGSVVFHSLDHKPNNSLEKSRIERAGGSVMIQRVNGSLAVSRSLGDFDYKANSGRSATEQLVTGEPDITSIRRASASDEFMLLACDGIWDVMANNDVLDFIRARLKVHSDLNIITTELVDTCLHKGSRDNMSALLVVFPSAPKLDPVAVTQDKELNNKIRNKIIEFCRSHPNSDLNHVFDAVSAENFSNLPPGGGLSSK